MMKKIAVLVPLSILMAAAVWAFAAGDAGDPLVSLAYLNGTFTNMVETEVGQRLDAADAELLEGGTGLSSESAGGLAATWKETRLKQFDVLQGTTGTNVLVLAGGMQVTYSAGTVVDVTTGTTVSSGAALTKNHRYMVAEDTEAAFTVTSKTAVVDYQGIYTFSDSNAVDYNAMAAALIVKALGRRTYSYVLGGIAGEAIMVAGYFVYEAAALKLGMGAAAGVLANVGQGAVGLVIALVLMALLKGSKALDKLAVQW